jgi:nicotinamidase-related amidase
LYRAALRARILVLSGVRFEEGSVDMERWVLSIGGWVIMIAVLGFCRIPLGGAANSASEGRQFRLPLRTEVQAFKGTGLWQAAQLECKFSTHQTAIVICDMWDNHWCSGAAERVGVLAHKMEPVLETCRAAGILIIHAPSDTMDFYKDYPQRRAMLLIPRVKPLASLGLTSPALPIDDSDGGCENPGEKEHSVWTRENPALSIKANDVISDNGEEIYSLLRQRGIKNLLFMGVHANMCILNRSFAIKQMTNWGVRCVLVRDLTDAMYDSRSRPYVSHAQGTELVIEYIEKYWCPTAVSKDLVKALE